MSGTKRRITIGRIMIAIALVAVVLAALPEPVFVIRLPNTSTTSTPLPNGSFAITLTKPAISISRFGVVLIVAIAGAITGAVLWIARLLIRIVQRTRPPGPK